ncbi:hypothetical protein, partial [Rhizobium pisi]|uniref:hypothetical protein n=1 Tax=Rhizobium pisi TaxID=574561 RepID=UPI0019804A1A
RLFFIKNLLEHLAEKILLLKPLIRGEDYPSPSTKISLDGISVNRSAFLGNFLSTEFRRCRAGIHRLDRRGKHTPDISPKLLSIN